MDQKYECKIETVAGSLVAITLSAPSERVCERLLKKMLAKAGKFRIIYIKKLGMEITYQEQF